MCIRDSYKIEALEQMLGAEPLKQSEAPFAGKNHSIDFDLSLIHI